jgi:hypothetical protein
MIVSPRIEKGVCSSRLVVLVLDEDKDMSVPFLHACLLIDLVLAVLPLHFCNAVYVNLSTPYK